MPTLLYSVNYIIFDFSIKYHHSVHENNLQELYQIYQVPNARLYKIN